MHGPPGPGTDRSEGSIFVAGPGPVRDFIFCRSGLVRDKEFYARSDPVRSND